MDEAGRLWGAVAFDEPTGTTDTLGGTSKAWTERHAPRAQWIYTSGNEGVQAARVAGREVYKVKIRSCAAARAITPAYQMRDTQRSTVWDIRSVDAIADRAWVYITVEGPQP